jgi:hypothetical protein
VLSFGPLSGEHEEWEDADRNNLRKEWVCEAEAVEIGKIGEEQTKI